MISSPLQFLPAPSSLANWMQFSGPTPFTIAVKAMGLKSGSAISARAGQTLKLKYKVSKGEAVC